MEILALRRAGLSLRTASARSALRQIILLAALPLLLQPDAFAANVTPVSEFEAKSAFLYNLVKFVTWPTETGTPGKFIFCVAEPEWLAEPMRAICRDRSVLGRSIEIRKLKPGDDGKTCNAIFVPARDVRRTASFLLSLQNAPILTVGENAEFLDAGGMVALSLANGRIQVQLNMDPIREAKLQVNAQLLRFARSAGGGN